jgi:flagellin
VKDGVSLVKTAEGALQEVQDMLNRMVELATQSANGTYDNETDRANLQAEVEALTTEIDRISESSNFNGINLLDGSLGAAASLSTVAEVDPSEPGKQASFELDLSGVTVESGKKIVIGNKTFDGTAAAITNATLLSTINTTGEFVIDSKTWAVSVTGTTVKFTAKSVGQYNTTTEIAAGGGILGAITTTNTGTSQTTAKLQAKLQTAVDGVNRSTDGNFAQTVLDFTGKTGKDVAGTTITINGKTYEFANSTGDAAEGNEEIVVGKTDNAEAIAAALGAKLTGTAIQNDQGEAVMTAKADGSTVVLEAVEEGATAPEVKQTGLGLTLQIGDTSDSFNQMTVKVGDMSSAGIGISGISVADQASAADAIATIKAAINTVSSTRGTLGATQNRLEHTSNNLSVMTENIQDAESTIRDTDIAEEMMSYTKNNILLQSAQAMLAQANQVPQGVLQLLQ